MKLASKIFIPLFSSISDNWQTRKELGRKPRKHLWLNQRWHIIPISILLIRTHAYIVHATTQEAGKCSLTGCQGRCTKYALAPNQQSLPLWIREGNLSQWLCVYLWPVSEKLILLKRPLLWEAWLISLLIFYVVKKYHSGRTLRKHLLKILYYQGCPATIWDEPKKYWESPALTIPRFEMLSKINASSSDCVWKRCQHACNSS